MQSNIKYIHKNSVFQIPLFFFLGFYFLIFILFFSSWFNTIHFIVYQDFTRFGSLIGRFLFLLFFCIYIIKPSSGELIYKTLLDEKIMNFFNNYIEKCQLFTQKNPYFSFVLVYFYVIFLILHWFMLLFSGIDVFVETIYQFLNLGRLLLFPIIIYAYILFYGPSSFHMGWTGSVTVDIDKIKAAMIELNKFLIDSGKKYPKTTGGGLALLFTGVAAIGHGTSVKRSIEDMSKLKGVPGLEGMATPECISDEVCRSRYISLLQIFLNTKKTPMAITAQDIQRIFKSEPTLYQEYADIITTQPLVDAQIYENILQQLKSQTLAQQSVDQAERISTSPLSRTTSTDNPQGSVYSPGSDNMPSSSGSIIPSKGPSSPLEDFWF